MELLKYQLLVVFLLACYFTGGLSIKCYSCNSVTDSKCKDPFKADKSLEKTDCKYCLKTKGEASGVQAIVRTCMTSAAPKDECKKVEAGGGKAESCTCSKDLCNAGTSLKFTPVFTLVLVVLAGAYNVLKL